MVTLVGKRWGPNVAGWLAGLPVVAGPILFVLALEHGTGFAAPAAAASLSAVFASVSFSAAYSHACLRFNWPSSLLLGLFAWSVAAVVLSFLPDSAGISLAVALLTLVLAPRAFPAKQNNTNARPISSFELALRAIAGALLTLAVTVSATTVGTAWSGLLTVFPVLGMVLAVFSHRSQGPSFVVSLLSSMASGLYSFAAFCFVLTVALPRAGIPAAFGAAVCAGVIAQLLTRRMLMSTELISAAREADR
jgi:uncharacterized membrane protein (GlpM family)